MAVKEMVIDKYQAQVVEGSTQPPTPDSLSIPPLQNGDRLTRSEFERRYAAMPHLKKAELIEGVVYMPSPIRHKSHGKPHGQIVGWLVAYHAKTPGTDFSNDATVRLDLDNEVQPDALLRLETECGGTSLVSKDDYIEGPPELIAEIAASSAAYDLHDKLKVYRRNGVQEYIVWQIFDKRLDWFKLSNQDEYVSLEPNKSGVVCSQVFPGLNLNVTALLNDDLATVLAELQQGLETAEYKEFVEQLANKAVVDN